jgi:hypothetical protein
MIISNTHTYTLTHIHTQHPPDPVADVLERVLLRDVIHQKDPHGPAEGGAV